MRLGFVLPDWEAHDATARGARRLAGLLEAAGHELGVLSGSPRRAAALALEPVAPAGPRALVRLGRADPFHGHWQKSAHPGAGRLVRGWLREARPELVHVFGWRFLTRDLVLLAARERIPAVVSLGDAGTSCLLGTRRLPGGGECDAPVAPQPCLRCAASVAPRTPWIPPDAQFLAQHVYHEDLRRELELARARVVHDEAGLAHALRFLRLSQAQAPRRIDIEGAPESQLLAEFEELYVAVRAAGAPAPPAPENPYATLLLEGSLREWDARAARASAEELGCEPPGG